MTLMRWQTADPLAGLTLHATATFDQRAFRFRNDDGSETAATWIVAENTDLTAIDFTVDRHVRLRIGVQETAGGKTNSLNLTLQYQKNGGTWTDVDGSTTNITYVTSSFVANQAATTSQLTTMSGTFRGGAFVSADASAATIGFEGSDHGENEYSLNFIAADLADGDVINFRLLGDGAVLAAYTQTPTVTVVKSAPPNTPVITNPADNDTVVGTVSLEATVSDPASDNVKAVWELWTQVGNVLIEEISENTTLVTSGATHTTSWNTLSLTPDTYELRAWAIDEFDVQSDNYDAHTITIATPNAPTLLTPADNSESDGTSFTWDFNPAIAGDTQDAFAFRRQFPDVWQDVISGTPTFVEEVNSVAFSPDDTKLAMGYEDSSNMGVYNTSDWSKVSGVPGMPNGTESVDFSHDGTYLAAGFRSTSPYLTVLNTSDWSEVSGTPVLDGSCMSVAFSPNGTYLAVGMIASPYLTVINTSDWSVVSGTPALDDQVSDVAFSPDSTYLAVGFNISPYLTILNTSDWSEVSGIPVIPSSCKSVAFSHDGTKLAVGLFGVSPYLTILNTSDWSEVSGTPALAGSCYSVAFSPDDTKLAAAHYTSPNLTIINTSDWSVLSGTPVLDEGGSTVDFSHDGTKLAVGYVGLVPDNFLVVESNGSSYWNGTAWQDTEVFITSANESLSLPSNAWE